MPSHDAARDLVGLYLLVCRVLELMVLLGRSKAGNEVDILVLRQELEVLRRQVPRPQHRRRDRLLLAALSRLLPRSRWHVFRVRPWTVLRWQSDLVTRRWTYPSQRPGRPRTGKTIWDLVLRLAGDNPSWGHRRIVAGALSATRVSQRASTLRGYRVHVRLYLSPYLGRIPLAELTAGQVQAMFTALSRELRTAAGPGTAASLARIRATLRTALNAALRQAAYHLIARHGLRRGEACGLRWCDLDLDGGVATINQQLQQYDGRIVVGPPKTARSVRTIALDRTTIAALRRLRQPHK